MPPINNNYTPTSDYTPKKVTVAIVAATTFFFTIIITIAILTPLLKQSTIEPINTVDDPHLAEIDQDAIDQELKILLTNSYDLSPEQLSNIKAVIREETINYTLDQNNHVTNATFLIDLNEPKLTFQVNDQINADFVSLTCPSIELVQDPDIFCIGYGSQSTIDANLSKYLPYHGTTPSGIDYSIWHDFDNDNKPRLNSWANICDDETIGKEVESSIKYWLMQHGIPNPDSIPLNFHYGFCNTHHE